MAERRDMAWCPKCAAFQLKGSNCEKCGARMARSDAQAPPWPSLLGLGLIGSVSLALMGAIFGVGGLLVGGIGIIIVALLVISQTHEDKKVASMTADERASYEKGKRASQFRKQQAFDSAMYGAENKDMICPHCQAKGRIRTKQVDRKSGISGGKATAAILTGGLSLFATGLSRKQEVTAARCGQCKSTWMF